MNNGKKKLAIFLSIVLVIVAIGGGWWFLSERKKAATAETIMSFSVNPSIQLVLNKKDKVIDVKATNTDGDKILSQVDFVGLTAEEAAELFVSISTEAGFIDVDTTGTKVSITLTGNKEDYTKLKSAVVENVNKYFDENGIIAGAVANVNDDVKTALEKISADIEDIEEKTKAELVELYAKHVEATKGVAYYQQLALETSYEALKTTFETATQVGNLTMVGLKATISSIKATIESQSAELAQQLAPLFAIIEAEDYEELQLALNNAKKAVKEAQLSDAIKESVDGIISSTQKILDDMKETYEEAKSKFDEDYKAAIEEAVRKSNEYMQNLKNDFAATVTEGVNKLNAKKAEFEANRAEIEQKIADYRATLVA